MLEEPIPFKQMERLYKASNIFQALEMGFYKTIEFITMAVITLKRFIGGGINAKNFMGPIGIFTISYVYVKDFPIIEYIRFLGLINAFIAVMNAFPMLPFDGGHIVFLAVEKIKGSPVSEKVQVAFIYAGLALVLSLGIYVTYHDILRIFNFWLK